MKRTYLLCILVYVSVILATFSARAYEENFDTGEAVDWMDASVGQSWAVDKTEYHQPDAGPVNVFTCYAVEDSNWKDYTFEVQIKPVSANNYAGVLFRVKDAGDGGTSWATGDFLYWLIGIGGTYSKLWDAPSGAAVDETPGDTLKTGEWNDVKVVATGNDFVMFLNGKEQKRYTDQSGEHDFGGIGLATYSADAFFDNVKVEGPGILGTAVNHAGRMTVMWGYIKNRQ